MHVLDANDPPSHIRDCILSQPYFRFGAVSTPHSFFSTDGPIQSDIEVPPFATFDDNLLQFALSLVRVEFSPETLPAIYTFFGGEANLVGQCLV